jgi:hypothetical protein
LIKASLQIPFLLNIANALNEYMARFPFAPKPTLQLLQKLDFAFSSLLHGEDVETGEQLPGFESGRKVTTTEKVRLRSLVESTRVEVVEISRKSRVSEDLESGIEDVTETELESEGFSQIPGHENERSKMDLDVARVYQRTLADLSESLDAEFYNKT